MTCTHGPEDLRHRGFKESGASDGVGCKGCNREYHKRARDNAKQGLSACGHPLDRRRTRVREAEGSRTSTYCVDCTNDRQRARRAEVRAGAGRAPLGGGPGGHTLPGEAPSRELTAGAVCGSDDRYTQPPKYLSAEDQEDMAATCARCPVTGLCTVWAFRNPYFEGVAGGQTWWMDAKTKRRLHTPLTRYVVQEDPQEVSA